MTMPTSPAGTYTQSVHETGTTGGTPVPGTTGNGQDVALALQRYDQAWQQAHNARMQVGEQLVGAQNALAQYQPENPQQAAVLGDPQQKALADQVTRLQQAYDSLLSQETKAASDRADAYSKAAAAADPVTRQAMQANADLAKTNADLANSQFQEWQATAPDRRAGIVADQRLKSLQADQAQLTMQLQGATAPLQIQQLQQQIQASDVNIQQAQSDLDLAKQLAPTKVAAAQQQVAQGEQALTQGQLSLQDLARQVRQAPTDEQAMQALQTALAQGQANLTETQQRTQQQAQLLPGTLAQQGATLAGTQAQTAAQQAQTQAGKQGTLYGLDDYITAQKDAIAKGLITPDQADAALQARISGTDVFTAAKTANDAAMERANQQIQQRQQNLATTNQQMATLGSMANTGLGQFMNLNNTVQPGSDVAGRGLLGYLNLAQQMIGQYSPPPNVQSPAIPPMLNAYTGAQQPAPQTPAAVPQTSAPITINIGGGTPNNPTGAVFQGNRSGVGGNGVGVTSTPFQAQGQPVLLDKLRPATTADVARIWGGG